MVIIIFLKSINTKNSRNSTNNTRTTTKRIIAPKENVAKIVDTSSIQVQAGYMSENVLNEIWQISYSLYPAKQI